MRRVNPARVRAHQRKFLVAIYKQVSSTSASSKILNKVSNMCIYFFSLRKVKMDQRKLMDNANTITDMAKVGLNPFLLVTFFDPSGLITYVCQRSLDIHALMGNLQSIWYLETFSPPNRPLNALRKQLFSSCHSDMSFYPFPDPEHCV